MKGRAIAQAFLPFPRTHALVVSGFSQKSLAVKALKTKQNKNPCLSFTVGWNGRRGRLGDFEVRLGSGDGMSKAEEPQKIGGE